MVRVGNRDERLIKLKQTLKTLGYNTGDSTDLMDAQTFRMIKAFQNDFNIRTNDPPDGVSGQTFNIILEKHPEKNAEINLSKNSQKIIQDSNNSANSKAPEGLTKTKEYNNQTLINNKQKTALQNSFKILKEGDSGVDVKLLQEKLRSLGFYTHEINSKFDDNTAEALCNFQASNLITPSGKLDEKTHNLLF